MVARTGLISRKYGLEQVTAARPASCSPASRSITAMRAGSSIINSFGVGRVMKAVKSPTNVPGRAEDEAYSPA